MIIGFMLVWMGASRLAFSFSLLVVLLMNLVADGAGDVDDELFTVGLARPSDFDDGSWYCWWIVMLMSTLMLVLVPSCWPGIDSLLYVMAFWLE